MTSWNSAQIARINALVNDPNVTLAFYCSDQHGRPANGGSKDPKWTCFSGAVHEIEGPLQICKNALHATFEPHRWLGSRVWIVALSRFVVCTTTKLGALRREVIGEILPEDCVSASVGARFGLRDLRGANLECVNLSGACLIEADFSGARCAKSTLTRANLARANLSGADFTGANLIGACLIGACLIRTNLTGACSVRANLSRADLSGACLIRANLSRADLSGACLIRADLSRADLSGACLIRADLSRAVLSRACLIGANLSGADLTGACLIGANLSRADLTGATLARANLTEVALYRANLAEADLSGVDLTNVDLVGVDLGDWVRGEDRFAKRRA